MVEKLRQDLLYALRTMKRSKLYAVAVLATLTIGIGANVSVFSVVYGVLFRSLPYPEADSLVRVYNYNKEAAGFMSGEFSPQDVDDLRTANHSFEKVAAFQYFPKLTGTTLTDGEPKRLELSNVSGDFFSTLGAGAMLGRTLTPNDDVVGKDTSVVLSHSLWVSQFGADPTIIGRTIHLDGRAFTVVGVMREEFRFPAPEVQIWAPLSLVGEDDVPHNRGVRWLQVVARLKPGATVQSALADTNVVLKQLELEHADTNKGWGQGNVVLLRESIIGKVRPIVLAVAASVGLLLLIACANLANMMLGKSLSRRREFAVRAALGATRARIISQVLTESFVYALIGGALSLLVARVVTAFVIRANAGTLPRSAEIRIDLPVVLFTLFVSAFSAVLFGLVPALRISSGPLREQLTEGGNATSEGRGSRKLRESLVVGQMALAVMLLIGAGLVLKSYVRLTQVDPGFNADHVLAMHTTLPEFPTGEENAMFKAKLIGRLQQVPGVVAVGASKTMPLRGGGEPYQFSVDTPEGKKTVGLGAGAFIVNSQYFKALQIPLVRGESFAPADDTRQRLTIVVSRSLAEQLWPGQEALGKKLYLGKLGYEVIGIAADVHQQGLASDAGTAVYVSQAMFPRSSVHLFIRTEQNPLALTAALRNAFWEVDPKLPTSDVQTMSRFVSDSVAQPRFFASIVNSFATIALLLAAVGIYGVIAYSVRQRTREIGVRIALGAQRHDVLQLVLGSGARLVLLGAAIGIVGALGFGKALSAMLFEVSPRDLTVFIGMPLTLMVVAVAATFIPASQAAKLDPLSAIRHES